MNVILFSRRGDKAWQVNLGHPLAMALCGLGLLLLLAGAFGFGLQRGERSGLQLANGSPLEWTRTFARQQGEIADLREQLQQRVDALAARLGLVNAHVIRMDALGKRLTRMANIDDREFNFDAAPPTGGPDDPLQQQAQALDLSAMIAQLEDRILLREGQMSALENVILSRKLREQIQPEGRPVRHGFMSSFFGERQDPFTGHQAFHRGVDFAGRQGDDVIAVAAGVVTFSGDRSGYGNTVEISHGNGYMTRYAHNSLNAVAPGQMVTRGQVLAAMGSTGRSTGPHVHFEVLRNGQQVNPASFVAQ